MARWQDMCSEPLTEVKVVTPIALRNDAAIESPSFKMRTNAQWTNHPFHSQAHFCHRVIVKVIPVIMCNEKNVDFRNVSHCIRIRPGKRLRSKRYGRGSSA